MHRVIETNAINKKASDKQVSRKFFISQPIINKQRSMSFDPLDFTNDNSNRIKSPRKA